MTEAVVTFGPNASIAGVVSLPAPSGIRPRRAVLLSNVGMHHHVGPYRLYVDLARALAQDGWHALRYDQLGMGDSAPRPSDAPDATHDMVAAMDFLEQQYAIEEFMVVSLCSGVDVAHAVALRDTRVRAVVFLDGYDYQTLPFLLRRYVVRGLQPGRWKRFIARRLNGIDTRLCRRSTTSAMFDRVYPPVAQFRADMQSLTARRVRTYFIFTGTVDQSFNAESQLYETLGTNCPRSLVAVTRLPTADHVFTSVAARRDVIERIRRWAGQVSP